MLKDERGIRVMGYFSNRRARKAVEYCIAQVLAGHIDKGFAHVTETCQELGAHPWTLLAEGLIDAGRSDEAAHAIERALEAKPNDWFAKILAAELAEADGRLEQAIEIYRELLQLRPEHRAVLKRLIALLQQAEDHEQIISVLRNRDLVERWERTALGAALFSADDPAGAVPYLANVVAELEHGLRNAMSRSEIEVLNEELEEVQPMHDEVVALVHGREGLIVAAAQRGALDAHAGVNYTLLGLHLAREWGSPPVRLKLETVEVMLQAAKQALQTDPENAPAVVDQSVAFMRQGKLQSARLGFEQARELDGRNFAANLGLGAVMDLERYRTLSRVAELPSFQEPEGLEQVVVDWAALTHDERRVVLACVYPLRGAMPRLVLEGSSIRILPTDVRTVDLPELAGLADKQDDELRSYAAITGLADARLAICKIEELLDVASPSGWVFAHEFAHLVYFHHEDLLSERVRSLHQRALDVGWVAGSYQLKNEDEFFAMAYTTSLCTRYGLESHHEVDSEGVQESFTAMINELAEKDTW